MSLRLRPARYHSLALRLDGTVVCWGSGVGTNIPANITNATAIAAGISHSLALLADNSVVAWGDNTYGQTNVPAQATNVVALAAGYYHNLALRADGTVVAWGKNTYGQCNVPTSLSNVVAITAWSGTQHGAGKRRFCGDLGWEHHLSVVQCQRIAPPWTVTDIAAISAGAVHNLGIKPGGGAFTWGYTSDQPSIPSSATNLVAIAAGTNYNLGLSRRVEPFWPGGMGRSPMCRRPPPISSLLLPDFRTGWRLSATAVLVFLAA